MKIILATDSFKGCMTSEEIENAICSASSGEFEFHKIPMSDGGEGMLETFIAAMNGEIVETTVHDPLMRPITAKYGITTDGTAIIETAKACGLTLMSPEERNPMTATTYGVGELIIHALHSGCRNFIIGLGGSGTSDSGTGMLKAILENYPSEKDIKNVIEKEMSHCRFTLASDVRNPLYGANGAAYTVNGEALDRFGVEAGVGLTADVNDNVELSLGYEGRFRDHYEDHTGLFNAKYKF